MSQIVLISHHNEESQPKLKLFENPLVHDRRKCSITPPIPSSIQSISGPINIARKQSYDESIENEYDDRKVDLFSKNDAEEEMFETLEFRRYEETTNMELFYDLFFVANLTTFNDVHDVNEIDALKSYAGFFAILWFLWLQVSLFDVRFVTDSILERIGKACQFDVMIGLAIVGPDFNSSDQKPVDSQMNHLRQEKCFFVWYITAILETAVNIVISSKWKVLSFRGSHLVQRMTLLTLIILGEGIIGVSKSIAEIDKGEILPIKN